ncbi:uncharacterized protein LOC115776907 [Archocentrus centrarchus]|uniref:uncharacterized protein LOC115776907 n=1 Tax=Archocentrus centrarchus TaxID=63155 RepID=UPI0011E9D975|nr:uncharacterized protein LOC115776907 [Archocentrus centrarchus]
MSLSYRRINIDFESEDEERQSRKNLPKPPAPPKPPAVPIIRSHQATSSTTSSHFHNTSNTVTIATRHPSAPTGHIIHPFATPTNSIQSETGSGTRTPLSEYNFQLKVFRAIEEVKAIALNNAKMLQALLTQQAANNSVEELDPLDELALPASSSEDLEALNRALESGAVRKKVVHHLAVIGGRDLRAAVYNILPKIVTNRLAEQYSLYGRKGKKNFSAHKHLVAVIFRAVRKNQGSDTLSDTEIQAVLGDWLKHAKCRKDKSANRGQD